MLDKETVKRIQDEKPTFSTDFINHANDEFLKARELLINSGADLSSIPITFGETEYKKVREK